MEIENHLPFRLPTEDRKLTPLFWLLVLAPTLLGAGHHIDHVIRGNHVGWPVTGEVNEFTYSLSIYPLLAVSLYLTLSERVDAGYWAGFLALSAGMLAYFHISPWAVEPPQDVMGPYSSPVAGVSAFAVLLGLIGSTVLGSAYAVVLHVREGS